MIDDRAITEARRRLREKAQNAQTSIALSNLLRIAEQENNRLREENERLRGIERAAQWYVDNPNSQRIAISQIKAAIDSARGKK